MSAVSEIIEHPLTQDALAARFRTLCADPTMANLPGKIELDLWGRILMTPASNEHGAMQARIARLLATLDGTALVETSVLTAAGVLVADVAWGSAAFMRDHGYETPYSNAPELCIEIASPSNSARELEEKTAAYLRAGAQEVWLVFLQSQRREVFDAAGLRQDSNFAIDSDALFE